MIRSTEWRHYGESRFFETPLVRRNCTDFDPTQDSYQCCQCDRHHCGLRLNDAWKRTNDVLPCIINGFKNEKALCMALSKGIVNSVTTSITTEVKGIFSNVFTGSENAQAQQKLKGAKIK